LIAAIVLRLAVSSVEAESETYSKHVVVAQEGHAADLGREVLRRGGNAIDAAIATAFALAVTLPEAGNLGGGGFIVAYLAGRREVVTVDFREMAPRSAGPAMYLGPDGKLRDRHRAGAWAAAVPGTVRGLGLAHSRYGKAPWADLVCRPRDWRAKDSRSRRTWPARSIANWLLATGRGPLAQCGTTSAGWATSPSRPPRSASRIAPLGAAATC